MWYLFTALPLSLKPGVLGRLLLPVPPFQRNAYPHVPLFGHLESPQKTNCAFWYVLLIRASMEKKFKKEKCAFVFSFPFRRGGPAARGARAELRPGSSGVVRAALPGPGAAPGSLPPPARTAQPRAEQPHPGNGIPCPEQHRALGESLEHLPA